MRKLLKVSDFKLKLGMVANSAPMISFSNRTGYINFNNKLADLMKLAHGGRVGFSEAIDAIIKTDDIDSPVVKVKDNNYFFCSKGFVEHVYKLLKIADDVSVIRIEVNTVADENGWYELDLTKIYKKITVDAKKG